MRRISGSQKEAVEHQKVKTQKLMSCNRYHWNNNKEILAPMNPSNTRLRALDTGLGARELEIYQTEYKDKLLRVISFLHFIYYQQSLTLWRINYVHLTF